MKSVIFLSTFTYISITSDHLMPAVENLKDSNVKPLSALDEVCAASRLHSTATTFTSDSWFLPGFLATTVACSGVRLWGFVKHPQTGVTPLLPLLPSGFLPC